jgi:NAD+ kinase
MRLEIVAHFARPGTTELVRTALRILQDLGHSCAIRVPDGIGAGPVPADLVSLSSALVEADGAPSDPSALPDLVVSFGGDGTFLRAARIAREVGVPIIGVNVGRVGFLAEIDPGSLTDVLPALLDGAYNVEERSTLEVTVRSPSGDVVARGWALNDVAVEKVARQRLVRLQVAIGSTPFASVAADAVIVATSTGSTAYALSAGGPIVNPSLDAMLIVPVAPHSLFDRTVVTDLGDLVTVSVDVDQDGALVSTDGMDPVVVTPGGSVVVEGGARPVRVARIADADFFGRVRRTFRLG